MCGGKIRDALSDFDNMGPEWSFLHGGRKSKNEASRLRAQIAREEWEDYKTRFQPIENILISYAQEPNRFKQPLREYAQDTINKQYGLSGPMADRRLASYGLRMNDEQRNEFGRRNQIDQRLAEVQALNQIERFGEEQLYNIVGGGINRAGANAGTQIDRG